MNSRYLAVVIAVSSVGLIADPGTLASKPALTYDLKIRIVDTNQLVAKTQSGVEGRNKLEQKQLQLRQDIQRKAQEIENTNNQYNTKKTTMSDAARKDEEAKLVRMRRDYENLVQTSEDELKMMAAREQENIIKIIVDSAKEYAVDNKLDLVVDKASGSVIYASEKTDCTTDLVKVMDKQYEKTVQLAKNKAKETNQLAAQKTGKTATT